MGHEVGLKPSAALAVDRYAYTQDFFERLEGSQTIFDIGTGTCPMRPPALNAGHVWRGFDLNPREEAVTAWDLSFPCPVDEKADVVIMLDVIEHLFNSDIALSNISDVMKPGAKILLTMPNPCWSRSRIHHLMYGDLAMFTQHDLDWNHHVFPVWPHVLEKVLGNHGLKIVEYVTLDGRTKFPRPKASFSYPFLAIEAGIRKLIERHDKRATGMSYAVIAELAS